MRTDLRHQEYSIPHSFEPGAHPVFGLTVVIFPTIVKEGNAAIDGLPNEADRGTFIRCIS